MKYLKSNQETYHGGHNVWAVLCAQVDGCALGNKMLRNISDEGEATLEDEDIDPSGSTRTKLDCFEGRSRSSHWRTVLEVWRRIPRGGRSNLLGPRGSGREAPVQIQRVLVRATAKAKLGQPSISTRKYDSITIFL